MLSRRWVLLPEVTIYLRLFLSLLTRSASICVSLALTTRVNPVSHNPLDEQRSIPRACECEPNNPDSLDARLFPSVVLAVAPAVTMDEAYSLSAACRRRPVS